MDERIYWIWISRIKNFGIKKFKILLDKYKNIQNIWNLKEEDLINIKGIGEKTIEQLLNKNYRRNLETLLNYIIKNNIEIIGITNEKYPKRLRQIYDPPIVIYVKGDLETLNNYNNISIVGGRNCSLYGKNSTLKLAEYLAKNEINIVSGLARGIDTYAHTGCIIGKGKTIAVLGSGLNNIYPRENIKLANEIINCGGAIISEYTIEEEPERLNFPARNRIISAISNKIVIVEARKNSGSIITADYALEQGKDIYVIPGNIDSQYSKGSNDLIKEGAFILTDYSDLLEY